MELELLGIKPNKKKQFETKGIFSVEDILQYLPRTYKDSASLPEFCRAIRFPWLVLPSFHVNADRGTENSS